VRNSILYIVPTSFCLILTWLWTIISPQILEENPRLFIFASGMLFAYITVRNLFLQRFIFHLDSANRP
jgi:hypothetical protein